MGFKIYLYKKKDYEIFKKFIIDSGYEFGTFGTTKIYMTDYSIDFGNK